MTKMQNKRLTRPCSVSLGTKLLYRTVDILGPEDAKGFKPPHEGHLLTVVGFRPHYVNNVVVREANGYESFMPLWMVEKAWTSNRIV